jgi:fructose/tagatose bisphosphate aldolase
VFQALCPFDAGGRLREEPLRSTLLAANANIPLEVQARAFAMAAADGQGSPMIIQVSHTAMRIAGGHPEDFPTPGAVRHQRAGMAGPRGIALARLMIEHYVDDYGARLVAMSLDHFKVPPLAGAPPGADPLGRRLAQARLEDALDAMAPVFGEDARPSSKALEGYVDYMTSPPYNDFRREFLAAVGAASPAWGMIDTEHLPPALVFAVTRDITDAIRQELGNDDILIEAEFGATGQSGAGEGYRALRGQELEVFASQISAFLAYTGADGIAYPIGMQHAAPSGETHPPDVERLETVHRTVIQKTGRYVPFAQHGGTGAAFIARGLVGKHNVNTAFLVAMASSLAEHVEANREGIRKGKKSAAGTGMYLKAVEAVRQKAIDQLEETGTYGMASRLEEEIRGG